LYVNTVTDYWYYSNNDYCYYSNNDYYNSYCVYSKDHVECGSGFIAKLTMPNSSNPVTVLVTNHHVIHDLSAARESTYQFSYLRKDSDTTPDPINGQDLIPQNVQGFYTCEEQARVSETSKYMKFKCQYSHDLLRSHVT